MLEGGVSVPRSQGQDCDEVISVHALGALDVRRGASIGDAVANVAIVTSKVLLHWLLAEQNPRRTLNLAINRDLFSPR